MARLRAQILVPRPCSRIGPACLVLDLDPLLPHVRFDSPLLRYGTLPDDQLLLRHDPLLRDHFFGHQRDADLVFADIDATDVGPGVDRTALDLDLLARHGDLLPDVLRLDRLAHPDLARLDLALPDCELLLGARDLRLTLGTSGGPAAAAESTRVVEV